MHAEERTDRHGGPEACLDGADLRVFGLREHVLAENVYRHAAAAGRALDVEAIENLRFNRGYGMLRGDPDAVADVAAAVNRRRADEVDVASGSNLDLGSVIGDDAG